MMLDFLAHRRHSPIAIDLGSDSIKMLQMHGSGASAGVCASARWRLPDAPPADPAQRGEMLAGAIRKMLREGGFKGRRVLTALSTEDLNIKNVRLPQMPEPQLAQAVRWEARERFGFDVGRDELAYLNAGEIRSGGEIRNEIILMAVRPETLAWHLELLQSLGLQPEHIDAQPVALFRSFERFLRRRADENSVSVVLDLARSATRVIVARGRQILFVKSLDTGGEKLNEVVSKRLSIPLEEARDLRLRSMLEESGADEGELAAEPADDARLHRAGAVLAALRDAIRGEAEALAKEVHLCLRYCSVTFRGLRPGRITLTGGESYDPALRDLLKEQLGMECGVGQPLRGIDVSGVDLGADRRGVLAEWAVCAGLALRCVALPGEGQEEEHEQHRLSA